MSEAISGAEFKKQLREGRPKLGLFLDLHHILTQATAYVKDVEAVSKEKGNAPWARRATALM
jgi:hypothetical protein